MAEPFSEMHDILLGYDTDLHFEDGDLMLTTGIDYIEREIYKLLLTSPGDWKADPNLGASADEFIGQPNTREVSRKIETRVMEGLRDIVLPAQVTARCVPTGYDKIICIVEIFISTLEISIIPFEFDYITGFTKISKLDERVQQAMSSKNAKVNDATNMRRPNKYWSRLRTNSL